MTDRPDLAASAMPASSPRTAAGRDYCGCNVLNHDAIGHPPECGYIARIEAEAAQQAAPLDEAIRIVQAELAEATGWQHQIGLRDAIFVLEHARDARLAPARPADAQQTVNSMMFDSSGRRMGSPATARRREGDALPEKPNPSQPQGTGEGASALGEGTSGLTQPDGPLPNIPPARPADAALRGFLQTVVDTSNDSHLVREAEAHLKAQS